MRRRGRVSCCRAQNSDSGNPQACCLRSSLFPPLCVCHTPRLQHPDSVRRLSGFLVSRVTSFHRYWVPQILVSTGTGFHRHWVQSDPPKAASPSRNCLGSPPTRQRVDRVCRENLQYHKVFRTREPCIAANLASTTNTYATACRLPPIYPFIALV